MLIKILKNLADKKKSLTAKNTNKMEDKSLKELIEILYKDFRKYLDLKLDYYKLDIIERLVLLLTKIFSVAVVWVVIIMFAFYASMTLGFFLGDLLGAYHWGFLIVSGVILLVGGIIILLRKTIITNPIINTLIEAVFKTKEKKRNEKAKNKLS